MMSLVIICFLPYFPICNGMISFTIISCNSAIICDLAFGFLSGSSVDSLYSAYYRSLSMLSIGICMIRVSIIFYASIVRIFFWP